MISSVNFFPIPFHHLAQYDFTKVDGPALDTLQECNLMVDTHTTALEQGPKKKQNPKTFFALKGQNVDPFFLLKKIAIENFPDLVFYEYDEKNDKNNYLKNQELELLKSSFPFCTFLGVKNSHHFFLWLAAVKRAYWEKKKSYLSHNHIIAISGSNGKTTTKEFLVSVLKSYGKNVCFTPKNNNNEIGIAQTILRDLKIDDEYFIAELGSNHPGEMKILCSILNPQWAIITNIGFTHLEFFHSLESVFEEETYVAKYIDQHHTKDKKVAYVLFKEELFLSHKATFKQALWIEHFSFDSFNENGKKQQSSSWSVGNKKFFLKNNFLETAYNHKNLAQVISLLSLFPEFSIENLLNKASTITLPLNGRGQWIKKQESPWCFFDAYNANPSSMKESLLYFQSFLKSKKNEADIGKVAIVLGEMKELGKQSLFYHQQLVALLKSLFEPLQKEGVAISFYIVGGDVWGPLPSNFIYRQEIEKEMAKDVERASYIFIKGSRSNYLEKLLSYFERQDECITIKF